MKTVKLSLWPVLAFLSLMLAGCQEDQSEFSLDSIEQYAEIQGTVYYTTGVNTTGTDYTCNVLQPAVGRKVFAEVAYNEYKNNSQGNKIYEAVTDENGSFSLSIPTTTDGINVNIRMEEFTAAYTEYLKMENGQPVFKTEMRRFSANLALNGLKAGSKTFTGEEAIMYGSEIISMEGFDEMVNLTGKLQLAIETGFRQGAFRTAENATMEFEIKYDDTNNGQGNQDATNQQLTFNYGCVTDAEGNYSISIPVRSLKEGFTINSIKVLAIGDLAFQHWTTPTASETLAGAYNLEAAVAANKKVTDIIEGYPYNIGETYLFFTPYYNGNITTPATPINWNDNLAGWIAGKEAFAGMQGKVTLKGSVETAIETAYGIGAYTKTLQTIKISNITDKDGASKDCVIATDQEGNFSVEIPVKDPNVKNTNLSVTIDNTSSVDYTHYTKDGTIVLKDGSYTKDITIRNPIAEWTDLGVTYCKFSPSQSNTPATWNSNLAGWLKMDGYNLTETLTGKLMFPVETSFAVGNFTGAANEMVEVDVKYNNSTTKTVAAPVAADGSFSIVIPKKSEYDQYEATLQQKTYSTNTFTHFTTFGDNSRTKLVTGSYEYDVKAANEDAAWTDLGTYYYKFTPTEANKPATWHAYLADWVKITDNNNILYANSVNATGSAKFAKEIAFATGTYKAAAGEVINISAQGKTFQVPTNAQGNFTVTIPIKNVGDEPTITVSTDAVEVDNFVHYTKGGTTKTKILEGKYTGTAVKETGAEWNELGTIYYKFTPTGTAPDTWHAGLCGWAYKKGYNLKANITGSVKLPVETGFWQGEYKGGAYQIVKLKTTDFEELVAATNADGNFTVTVPVQFDDDELSVTWIEEDISSDDAGLLTHYRNYGSATTQDLEGTYSVKKTVRSANAQWLQMGTRYYKFTPTTSTKNWTDKLPGWAVYGANENIAYVVSGSVKKAIEKNNGGVWTADWATDGGRFTTVTVDGTQFNVVTDNNGKFSFRMQAVALPDNISLTVTPEDEEYGASQLSHHPDNTSNASTLVNGRYTSADNIQEATVEKPATGNIYTYTSLTGQEISAKMLFEPASTPDGWTSYDWNSILNN